MTTYDDKNLIRKNRFLPDHEKFQRNHIKIPLAGCWIWLGAPQGSNRYGALKINGKAVKAHRYSYMKHHGLDSIPNGMIVMHECDTPLCVNPHHLRLGTQQENEADKLAKGRQARGAALAEAQAAGWAKSQNRPGNAILTKQQVAEIRASDWSQRALAKQFGVSQAAIHNVKARKTHVHW
jgi:hypothetical protein